MTSKSPSPYGNDPLNRTTDILTNPAPHRRERTRPSVPATNRDLSELLESPPSSGNAPAKFDPSSSRHALIATAAYYRAESRGFFPGYAMEDWLAAEREIDGVGTEPT